MRLLFLKPKHIGDALLLTPTLMAVKAGYPEAVIWVLVRRGTESILAGCPAIDRVVTTASAEAKGRRISALLDDLRLVRELLGRLKVPHTRTTAVFRPGRFARGLQTSHELGSSHTH